jgi:hypothetical protein
MMARMMVHWLMMYRVMSRVVIHRAMMHRMMDRTMMVLRHGEPGHG